MLHMIRFYMGDENFKQALRAMNIEFRHSVVTSEQIESFLNERCQMDLTAIFDQYLRNKEMPRLEYKLKNKQLQMRLSRCMKTFTLPIHFALDDEQFVQDVGQEWVIVEKKIGKKFNLAIEPNLLIKVQEVPSGRQ